MSGRTHSIRIALPCGDSLSGLLQQPDPMDACFVVAHGAGAGMNHPFLADLSAALGRHRIATLRFQFPFMEKSSKRPDAAPVAQSAVRAAVGAAAHLLPGTPLFAGGKSFGGRMTSQAQAAQPLDPVRGLIFIGFPLHASGKPSKDRAGHLSSVTVPMLFLQGTRDKLADLDLMRGCVADLGHLAHLHVVEGADHAFQVLVRSGRTDAEVMEELARAVAAWIAQRP